MIILFDKCSDRGSRECSGSTEQSIRAGGGAGMASQEKGHFSWLLVTGHKSPRQRGGGEGDGEERLHLRRLSGSARGWVGTGHAGGMEEVQCG